MIETGGRREALVNSRTVWLRRWVIHALRLTPNACLLAVALTGAYLAGPARARMDMGTAVVVLLHLILGILLGPALLWSGVRTFRGKGQLTAHSSQPTAYSAGAVSHRQPERLNAGVCTSVFALAVFLTAGWLIDGAARGRVASDSARGAHIVAGLAFTFWVLGSGIWFGMAGFQSKIQNPKSKIVCLVLSLLGLITLFAARGGAGTDHTDLPKLKAEARPSATLGTRYQPEEYYRNLTATNARQAGNPLFPAGTKVTVTPGGRVRSAAYCGTAGCHPESHREWHGSFHQQASGNPIYQHVVAAFAQERGPTARRWCEGCHAPVESSELRVESSGKGDPADLSTLNSELSTGVDCLTCHGAVRVTELSGNGRFELQVPSEYPFAEHRDPRLRWLHGFLLRLRPGPHRAAYLKPELHGQSEFCASCHRTSYNLPQNGYKFLRVSDEYGTWQAGPDSAQSIHGFYPPGPLRRCQDCHGPHSGGVQAFRARSKGPGARSPMPLAPGPLPERLNAVTVDLLALRRIGDEGPRTGGDGRRPEPLAARQATSVSGEELVAPLERAALRLRPGEAVTVDVVVRNRGVGHEFPVGSSNLKETWLEFDVRDTTGHLLLRSGGLGPDGEVEPETHTYGLIALDREGRRLDRGDLWRMVTPLYHRTVLPGQPDEDRRSIQPGESDVARYRVEVPSAVAGPLQLRARLWQRRRRPFSGVQVFRRSGVQDRSSERLILVAEDSVTLPVGAFDLSPRRPVAPSPRRPLADLPGRFYDYGIGLLLQGDLSRAQRVMRQVQAWVPRNVQGYLGLGRVYLTEGDLLAARAQFEQARHLAPDDPRLPAFLGTTDRKMGQYDRALAILTPLARDYPRDRLLWFDIGMSHYLAGRYEQGAKSFETMLGIDPDDLSAHYNLMQCLRRLRRIPEARREETIYQVLREDDRAKAIVLSYLRRHPSADQEALTIHEHPVRSVRSGP